MKLYVMCIRNAAAVGVCEETEFSCVTGGQCVLNTVQCDGTTDCDDGSDEYLCGERFRVKNKD